MGRFEHFKSNNPFQRPRPSSSTTGNDNVNDVPPPPGPPPGYQPSDSKKAARPTDDYAPPPGPPPGRQQADADAYAQPPGPPPGRQDAAAADYAAPPPGAPPGTTHHDWQSVPLLEDTSGYPPPPDIFTGHDRSWAHNADEQQAAEGERWCQRYPLLAPLAPPPAFLPQAPFALVPPQSNTFCGRITPPRGAGVWTVATDARSNDHTITAQPPLYYAAAAAALHHGGAPWHQTIYFEVRLLRALGADAGVAVGFVALPYPGFRLPGWHRGSVAVHSDDGHRYANDRWGGVDFVRPWGGGAGVVVGIGMTFSGAGGGGDAKGKGKGAAAAAAAAVTAGRGRIEAELFFTREGAVEARWDVHAQRDGERDLEPLGVQGAHDLLAAVGSFGRAELEVVWEPARWVYKGVQ